MGWCLDSLQPVLTQSCTEQQNQAESPRKSLPRKSSHLALVETGVTHSTASSQVSELSMGKVGLLILLRGTETPGHFNEVAGKPLRNVFERPGKCCEKA